MDVSVVVDAVSTSIGAGGLLVATLANRRAKQANRQAEIVNDLAARSLAKAEEANRIAEQGNQIAGDANTLAQRALATQADIVEYCWRLKVDADLVASLVNDSAHAAHQVTVVIDRRGEFKATAQADHCPAFSKIPLDLEGLIQQEVESQRSEDARPVRSNGVVVLRPPWHQVTLRLTVTAVTDERVPHSDVSEEILTVYKDKIETARKS